MCKAVLFDFNGKLLSDSPQNEAAWLEFAKTVTGKILSPSEFQENVHGKNNRLVLKYLFDRSFTKEESIELGEKKEEIYRQMVRQDPTTQHLMSGAPEFLDYLKEKRIPVNIATAAGYGNVRFYFDFFHLNRWFDFEKIIYDNGEMKSKPFPDYYIQSAERINVDLRNVVIFEDSYSGLLAAKNAGAAKIIAIEIGDNRNDLMSLNIADIVVKDYFSPEVKKLFKSN